MVGKVNKNVNELIDTIDKIAEELESRVTRVVRSLANFHGGQEGLPALFADLTWMLVATSSSIQPSLRKALLTFVEKENLDVRDDGDVNNAQMEENT